MGKVVITLNVPDGMEDVVKSFLEKEAKLIVKRLSKADFKSTFGILKGKRKSVNEIEADIYAEWEV
ncbi:cbb3-type cytochrome c oxidase subunit II [Pyrococcus sp. NA2]|uniref:cbb3-type cytochrome c oxidase subunit II n=1 Tax=Pyrococcus sp. (strain NA2) TaxID=342949 RepID=UPI000AAE2859|nr:cbb3-type cytochrome c oxidase subunit II [Pyrococcus sp. NA2]